MGDGTMKPKWIKASDGTLINLSNMDHIVVSAGFEIAALRGGTAYILKKANNATEANAIMRALGNVLEVSDL